MKGIVLFDSTHQALWAEDILKEANIKSKLTTVPRELSSDCGYCISFIYNDKSSLQATLDRSGVIYKEICSIK